MDKKAKSTISHIAARLKEPSSWAGIGALLILFGVHLDAGIVQDIVYIGTGVSGIVAFFLPEND